VSSESGFTLMELIIVVAVLVVIATVAIPNLLAGRVVANERSVLSALRSVVTAQAQNRAHVSIDTDRDGQAEAALLQELAGTRPLRGVGTAMVPPALPVSLGEVDEDGHILHHGYHFALFLPDATGTGTVVRDGDEGTVDADMAENYWTCIAWPAQRGTRGSATFFTNQTGDIVCARLATYSGKDSVPPAGAALVGVDVSNIATEQVALGRVGADGNLWTLPQ
jgi:prepilin-type N-terminal cleavage/methylation domain-containing protein